MERWQNVDVAKPAAPPAKPDPRVEEARKKLLKVANWELMDERHRRLDAILDTVVFLRKMCENVRDNPEEAKYRQVRIMNAAFTKHVRSAPGGEAYLHEAGWKVAVANHERYWQLDAAPGSVEWLILEEACRELDKLHALLTSKIQRGAADHKAEQQRYLETVRAAIEEDKQDRAVHYQQR